MACRLDRESVKIPTHSCMENLSRAAYIATSSARMVVRVSSVPPTSIYMDVLVGTCTTAAPSRECPLMSEPSLYTHCSGWYLEFHSGGIGAKGGVDCFVSIPLGVLYTVRNSTMVLLRHQLRNAPWFCHVARPCAWYAGLLYTAYQRDTICSRHLLLEVMLGPVLYL